MTKMLGMPSACENLRLCQGLDTLSKHFVYVGPEEERRGLVYSRPVPFQALSSSCGHSDLSHLSLPNKIAQTLLFPNQLL